MDSEKMELTVCRQKDYLITAMTALQRTLFEILTLIVPWEIYGAVDDNYALSAPQTIRNNKKK